MEAEHGSVRAITVAAAFLVVASLGACTPYIPRPATPHSALVGHGASYADALGYIETARREFDKALRQIDDISNLSKMGAGTGVAGAGVSAAFGAKTNVILGFLTFGALSYSANSGTDPKTLGQILNAGLGNLECIESAGEQADLMLAGQRFALEEQRLRLAAVLATLKQHIAEAGREPDKYASLLPQARDSLLRGQTTLGTIDAIVRHNPVAGEMIRATRRTVAAVNQEMRERAPSIEAISRSGSITGVFLTSGAGIATQAREGANAIGTLYAAHDDAHPLNDVLASDQNALQQVLQEIGDLRLPQESIAAVTACKTQFAASAPLALVNSTPIELAPGASAYLRTVSGATVAPDWIGPAPVGVTWRQEIGVLILTADAGATAGSYRLRVTDMAGHSSDEFTLNVVGTAMAAGVQNDAGGPPPPPGRN